MIRTLRQNLKDFLGHLRAVEKPLGDLTVKMKSPIQKEHLFFLGFKFTELKILLFLFKRLFTPQIESLQKFAVSGKSTSVSEKQNFIKSLGTLRTYYF